MECDEHINTFVELSTSIHPFAEEVTIVGNDIEENLFDATDYRIADLLGAFVNLLTARGHDIQVEQLQQFSFQPADGVVYKEHKMMAVLKDGKTDCTSLCSTVTNPHDDYCVNYFLDSNRRVVKFYDLDVWKYKQPGILQGSQMLTHWGQGMSTETSLRDLYFLHCDAQAVAEFYNLPVPYRKEIHDFCTNKSVAKVFGLTYNEETLQPMKLKMYYYPHDEQMEYTVFDEIL